MNSLQLSWRNLSSSRTGLLPRTALRVYREQTSLSGAKNVQIGNIFNIANMYKPIGFPKNPSTISIIH